MRRDKTLRVGLLPLLHLLQLLPLLLLLPVLCHLSNPHRHAPPSPSSLWPQTGQEGEKTRSKNVARLSSPEQSLCFPPPLRQSWGCIPGKETEDLYTPPLSVGFLHTHTRVQAGQAYPLLFFCLSPHPSFPFCRPHWSFPRTALLLLLFPPLFSSSLLQMKGGSQV